MTVYANKFIEISRIIYINNISEHILRLKEYRLFIELLIDELFPELLNISK